ncbi:MAG: dTDP-4-dehydrorhamnose reductase [Verrucomicrobiales bacterium]|nr:dTDP-4-dehydrorhamnose reductase [Verrucomicrobiales bacterium]
MNPKQQRVSIVGANGRLGRAVLDLCNQHHETVGMTRHYLDLAWSRARIREALAGLETDVMLLTAGNTNVDHCERDPEAAWQANCHAVAHIAEWCAERDVRLINFSTDYVFDGEKETLYREDDPVNPLSQYGRSKLDGEYATMEASDRNLVVRLCWLFGPGKPSATPDWSVQGAVELERLTIVADKVGAPSYTRDIADALLPLLFNEAATGILHLSNGGSCTWLEWGQFCIDSAVECGVEVKTRYAGGVTLQEVFGDKANRPRHTLFSTEKYTALTGRTLPDWRQSVREYVRDYVAPRFL